MKVASLFINWSQKHRYQWTSSSWSVLSSSSADSALNSLYHKCVSVFICAWPSFTSCIHITQSHLYILIQLNSLSICLRKKLKCTIKWHRRDLGQTECNCATKNLHDISKIAGTFRQKYWKFVLFGYKERHSLTAALLHNWCYFIWQQY